jgi:hypothetical protein
LADQAQKEGESVVPTVMGEQKSRPGNVKKVETPKKMPDQKQPPKRTTSTASPYPKKQPEPARMKKYKAALEKDIQTILAANMEHQQHKTVTFYLPEQTSGNPEQTGASNPAAKQPGDTAKASTSKQLPALPFGPGDILYSANVIALNSDVPSPVVVQIVSGAAKNTQFFGQFTRHEKHMLLRFNRLKDPYGNEYPIDAIALDMHTSSAAVRSGVDSHYLARWGGLIAASFLEGFGEAVAKSGQSFKSSDTTDTFTYPEYDLEDQAWIAAGKVGNRLAGIMEKNFNRPPTVYTDHNELFAVMILSTKR